jgi:hypothetical protein
MIIVRNPGWEAEVRALQPDWDSYGAVPIAERAIKTMRNYLAAGRESAERPRVVPLSNGGLQLEYSHREICFEPDGTNWSARVDDRSGER